MGRRVLWLNPAMTDANDVSIGKYLRAEARSDTTVDVASIPGVGPVHLEFSAYELAAADPSLRIIRWAEGQGYDAAVIGCFYDPYVRAARELTTQMPIVAPAESSIRVAQALGEQFSILVGRDKWVPAMRENVRRYGAENYLASFRTLGMGVTDFQAHPSQTEDRIRKEARAAVEADGADVVIVGCTIAFGFYRKLQAEIGVPVIDASVAALRHAELLADVAEAQDWRHSSRLGYLTPEPNEYLSFLQPMEPNLSEDPR